MNYYHRLHKSIILFNLNVIAFDKLRCLVPDNKLNYQLVLCIKVVCSKKYSFLQFVEGSKRFAVNPPDGDLYSLCSACSRINHSEDSKESSGMGPWSRRKAWGRLQEEEEEEGGDGCDVLINKRQLCMMLTAGWSGPRHNPPRLLLTFQRPGAYPRRCAQSSLSRSSSVQGSGGGQPWPSLPCQSLEKHVHSHSQSEGSLQILYAQAPQRSHLVRCLNPF